MAKADRAWRAASALAAEAVPETTRALAEAEETEEARAVEVEAAALEAPGMETAETGEMAGLLSQYTNMKVVRIDESLRTYVGPWDWHNQSVVTSPHMLYEEAVAAGYTLAPPPPVPVPTSVPKWAFLLVLRRMGKEATLKAAIAGYTGPNADRVRAKWEVDPDIERDGQTVDDLGKAVGLTPAQVDQVFRDAEKEANQ